MISFAHELINFMKQPMKKITILLVLAITIFAPCLGQTSVWKVTGKGTTMYIGGTIHMLRPQDHPIPVEFDSAYSRSELVVLEADIGKLEDPSVAQELLRKAMYNDTTTLRDVLSKEVYDQLEQEFSKFNVPLATMEKFKPSIIIITLTLFSMQQLEISDEGVDKKYYLKAKEDEKMLHFFETVDDQIDMIVNMGEGMEDEFVLNSLKDNKSIEELLPELIATWRNGTAKTLLKQLKEMQKDYPDIYRLLVQERNNKWMPKIENYFNDEVIELILVGALHLHGKDGILNQLKKSGFTVEQLLL